MKMETRIAPLLLPLLSAGMVLLSVFQWGELRTVQAGGHAVCSINATVNCETVWTSHFAERLHHLAGLPVAALGLVWGLCALVVSLFWLRQRSKQHNLGNAIAALRLLAAVGVFACAVFAVASIQMGAICLTCLGTYGLVLGFAGTAIAALPQPLWPPSARPDRVLLGCLALTVIFFGMLRAIDAALPEPGARQPLEKGPIALGSPRTMATDRLSEPDKKVFDYLSRLSPEERQEVSEALSTYRRAPRFSIDKFVVRERLGPLDAPVRMVDFTDIRCSHCRHLQEIFEKLKKEVPRNAFSLESRHFPLDHSCNPSVPRSDGQATSCVGAKTQICMEGKPKAWELRNKLFALQADLTAEKVLEIASGFSNRPELERCIASAETASKLSEDIQYALTYQLQGTPLLLVNGREALPFGPFILAMVMAGGNDNSPAFMNLPPPR